MNSITKKINSNPREKASFISKIFYWWTKNLYIKAYKKALSIEDLYDPLKIDRASHLGDRIEKVWNQQLEKGQKPPNLWITIFLTFRNEFLLMLLHHAVVEFILALVILILLSLLLKSFNPQLNSTDEDIMFYAVILVVTNYFKVILKNHKLFNLIHFGGRIRIAICSLIYRKALKLSKGGLGEMPAGKIVNLIANDLHKFDFLFLGGNFVWTAPFSVLSIGFILYYKAGYTAIVGMTSLLLFIPIQVFFGYLSAKYRQQAIVRTDERVQLLDEIISAVQVIKMYAWEKPFCTLVETVRKLELNIIRKSTYFRDIYLTFDVINPRIALYLTIVATILFEEQLSSEIIFSIFPFYYLLSEAILFGARGLDELADCTNSLNRVQKFLLLEEFSSIGCSKQNLIKKSNNEQLKRFPFIHLNYIDCEYYNELDQSNKMTWAVKLKNLTVKWDLNSSDNTLENINLEFEKGKLYIVIGMVGSGKSSLLSSILGEINVVNGSVEKNESLVYAGQEPWVFGNTIRQNILFGESFNKKKYLRTIEACSLIEDFQQLPQGDCTLVGEKGVSLSGGQKARINLARAVYREADIYLLDDPLSAVDAHVGKHLFQECLMSFLKSKTRILATHQLQFIKEADGIILLSDGIAQYYASYHKLFNDHPEYNNLVATEEKQENTKNSLSDLIQVSKPESQSYQIKNINDDARKLDDIIESSSKHSITDSLLLKYFQSGSNLLLILIMTLLFVLAQTLISLNDVFVSIFVSMEESRYQHFIITNDSNIQSINTEDSFKTETYVYIYTTLIVLIFIFSFIKTLVYCTLCLRSSDNLHNSAFEALIKTNLRFFHMNPSGRILNRFSKDVTTVDVLLPFNMMEAIQILSGYMGAIIISCIINPIFIIIALLILVFCYLIRGIYLKASNNIKRLEGLTRAPVYTHLNETLNGISTIRAYGTEDMLKTEFHKFQDLHTSSWFYFISCKLAYNFILKMFNSSFAMLVTFGIIVFRSYFNESHIGLVLTQMFCMTVWFAYGSLLSAEAENQLTSVERLLEYAQLPKETKHDNLSNKKKKNNVSPDIVIPPSHWPDQGCISFENLSLQYSKEDGPVLKQLNFIINPKEKIGIVGRTGAGKSSLISALFRLSEIEGTIKIDGVDTGSISLELLRSRISIIPQDPVLFSGTLRHNLDPFKEFSDQDIWDALEQVKLKKIITTSANGLDCLVLDKGSNFSVGQRQLVCLARAILRKNRILLLDEATANVDPYTDSLIQQTIRTKFDCCTVLTVAHRLNTIIDSDKVMVMANGYLVEYDHPYILLQKEDSHFTSLLKETDEAIFTQLSEITRNCYNKKYL